MPLSPGLFGAPGNPGRPSSQVSEYEALPNGRYSVGRSSHNVYDSEEDLARGVQFALDDRDPEFDYYTRPLQGRLFGSDVGAPRVAEEDVKRGGGKDRDYFASLLATSSNIPQQHMRQHGHQIVWEMEHPDVAAVPEAVGSYRQLTEAHAGPSRIRVAPGSLRQVETTVHEFGHRVHLAGSPPQATEPVAYPDPGHEAHADAYADRFAGSESPLFRPSFRYRRTFDHLRDSGYSTDHPRWNPSEQAMYGAIRAHAGETGEAVHPMTVPDASRLRNRAELGLYKKTGQFADTPISVKQVRIDATLHELLSGEHPAAKQALRQTGLKSVGAASWRRHQDMRLLAEGQYEQGSMLVEMADKWGKGKAVGYVVTSDAAPEENFGAIMDDDATGRIAEQHPTAWPRGMSVNQFGESPRTMAQLRDSLEGR